MELLYTDARIVVCLKPAGVLSTDEPGGMPELLRRALGEPETGCVRTVHRLDRPVGGVMVFARSRMADSLLSRQVQAHTFEKDYLAVLEGVPAQASGVLEDQLRRDTAARRTCVADAPGPDTRPARLSYRVLGEEDGRALVLIRLETGRTHQIRVHLAHIGCPIAGDYLYGTALDALPGRFALHSASIRLTQPITGETIALDEPLPEGLERLMAAHDLT